MEEKRERWGRTTLEDAMEAGASAPRDPASLPQGLDDPLLVPVAWPLLAAITFGLVCGAFGFGLGDRAGQLRGEARGRGGVAEERLRAVRLACVREVQRGAGLGEWRGLARVCDAAAGETGR